MVVVVVGAVFETSRILVLLRRRQRFAVFGAAVAVVVAGGPPFSAVHDTRFGALSLDEGIRAAAALDSELFIAAGDRCRMGQRLWRATVFG